MSHGGGGGDRWLVSYSDFMTLLMVLFVILYSMSQVDVEKYKQLADGLKVAFAGGDSASVIDPMINLGGGADQGSEASPIIIPGIPQSSMDTVEVAGQLSNMLAVSDLGDMVSVQNNVEGVLISVSEKLLYVPGTVELQPEAYPVLDTVIDMIKHLDNDIRVIGHTDDSLPAESQFQTNWDLSLARAMTIVKYFQNAGIVPERLIAAGRGEYLPLFPNDSPEHRALNSRSEIIIIYELEEDIIDLEMFQAPIEPEVEIEIPETILEETTDEGNE